LRAIDVASGEERWAQHWPADPLVAGVTATAGGVLFTGDLDNNFLTIDAANGEAVYRFNTGGSVGGGVIGHAIGDKQLVATTSSVVSGFFGGTGNATIVIFSLP
jgi:alcohol dehydrogenase (cytochrome c)